jgi:hypothetical protein
VGSPIARWWLLMRWWAAGTSRAWWKQSGVGFDGDGLLSVDGVGVLGGVAKPASAARGEVSNRRMKRTERGRWPVRWRLDETRHELERPFWRRDSVAVHLCAPQTQLLYHVLVVWIFS